ncbi:MAG: response regulator [Bacteroidales bacterium]|nr:response regulator [Bacteroidales bacterium]
MSFVNKISGILKHDRENNSESENVQRTLLLNFTIVAVALLNLIFSITNFFFFERLISYILFPFFLSFTLIFFIFKKTKNYRVWSFVSIILITILFLILIIKGAGDKTSIIWGLTFPTLVFFTFCIKKANLFSLIFFSVTLIIFIVPGGNLWVEYPADLILRYTGAYITILLFMQYYLRLKQQALNNKNKQIIDLQKKLMEKQEFLSKLSYQIRTPLNNIAGIFNLKRDVLGGEVVEEAELSVSNLITIVNSIPETFDKRLLQIKGEKVLFNINSVIKKSVSLFETDKYSNLRCSLHLSGKIPQFVFGDRLILIQIIISVIDFFYNNNENDSLKVDLISTTKDDSGTVLLKIKGNADCPVLKECLSDGQYINFEKIENKELLMIKELTSILGGHYEINNNESETSFLFSFDFSRNEIKEQASKIISDDNFFNKKNRKDLKDVTVLLVEDDVMNSKVMTLNLQKHVKKIIIAENGKDALEKYASTRVDIILMDIRMPLMDGFKTTEKIREAEIGIGYHIPIIAVTANASSEIKKRCFDVGMNDYTTKPTNFKLLLKKMKAQLS